MILKWVPEILIALAVPLVMGIVPRNCFYGFRTRKARSSDAEWYSANRTGGTILLIGGLMCLAIQFLGLREAS